MVAGPSQKITKNHDYFMITIIKIFYTLWRKMKSDIITAENIFDKEQVKIA